MTIDTNELRRLAQAATPGPWYVTGKLTRYVEARIDGGLIQEVAACGPTKADGGYGPQQEANARLLAATNPATILELLDRLEAAEKERDDLRAEIAEMEKQEPVAYLWANIQSGSIEVTWDEDAFDREMWHRSPLYTTPGEQLAPSVPDGWLRAVDEALVIAHIGVANVDDTYDQARAKLNNLIGFHVDVATDPKVNGGYKLVPIEPTEDMLRVATAEYVQSCSRGLHPNIAWRRAFQAMLSAAPEAKS